MCHKCKNGTDFVHLHTHSQLSLLDGHSDIGKMVKHVTEQGQSAVALTDHGVMYGSVPFYNACVKEGIKPIIGMEGYMTMPNRLMTDKIKAHDWKSYHVLMLAKNQQGYQNLVELSSLAHTEGFYRRPRIDREILAERSEGLIVTSGCLGAEIPDLILQGKHDKALERAKWYQDVFGDDFYLEMQYRERSPNQNTVNQWIVDNAKKHGFKPVITTDAHYIKESDAYDHDMLLCMQTSSLMSLPYDQRMKFDEVGSYSILSTDRMLDFVGDYHDPIWNTVEVAEKCDVRLESDGYKIPEFSVPVGYTPESFLREICEMGIRWRYGDESETSEVKERVERELGVINSMNFDSYFLVMWDLIMFCRQVNIFYNVRGSGAGSIVAYALGITSVDPLLHDLLFERFLKFGRINMPDIDLDLEDEERNKLIEYIVKNYGDDHVANIITFGTLGGKSAIHSVGRVLGVSREETGQITKHVKTVRGKSLPLEKYIALFPDLKKLLHDNPQYNEVYQGATRMQGFPNHASSHAAGFIITQSPMTDYVPVRRLTGNKFDGTGLKLMTQWDMHISEDMGLVKFDLLGLATLTVIHKCCDYIRERHGQDWNLDNIPYQHTGNETQDALLDEAFDLIGKGMTAGVFQIEGDGITGMMTEMQPKKFDHIVAGVSLYRPGPMGIDAHTTYIKRLNGEETPVYYHPDLEEILGGTFGLLVYQEQVMQLAVTIAGYIPSESDTIRKAVGKKIAKDLAKHYNKFVGQGVERGYPREVCEKLWEEIEFFADYGFNRSHATDYGKITMQTAFLKTHYPIEYMTALLQVYLGNSEKMPFYLGECKRRMKIPVLPPSVNYSKENFSIEVQPDGTEAIRIGFTAIKNFTHDPTQIILKSRGDKLFKDYADFANRVPIVSINKKAHEFLIKSGALDELADKSLQLNSYDPYRNYLRKAKKKKKGTEGLPTFFDMDGIEEELAPVNLTQFVDDSSVSHDWSELLAMEFEAIGFYVTARPTDEYGDEFYDAVTTSVSALTAEDMIEQMVGSFTRIGGQVAGVRHHTDKNNRPMVFVSLVDWHETAQEISITIFSSLWKQPEAPIAIEEGAIIIVGGKVNQYNGRISIVANEITRLDKPIVIKEPERKEWKGK